MIYCRRCQNTGRITGTEQYYDLELPQHVWGGEMPDMSHSVTIKTRPFNRECPDCMGFGPAFKFMASDTPIDYL